jgi:hypothetical protein
LKGFKEYPKGVSGGFYECPKMVFEGFSGISEGGF